MKIRETGKSNWWTVSQSWPRAEKGHCFTGDRERNMERNASELMDEQMEKSRVLLDSFYCC